MTTEDSQPLSRALSAGCQPIGPRLDALPLNLAARIASYLDRGDALALCLTCRALVPAGESRVYASLDLLFHDIPLDGHTDPAIASGGHRPTPRLVDKARALGDAVVIQGGMIDSDLLQGGLRHFARLLDRVPDRRGYVRGIYVDCSQVSVDRMDDIRRSITTLGTLRLTRKLTVVLSTTWEQCLRTLVLCVPHVERLVILCHGDLGTCRKPDIKIPRLRYLAVEGMSSPLEGFVARMIDAVRLDSLVIMDWQDAWIPARVDIVREAISKRRGVKTLFIPQRCFGTISAEGLRNVQVLGVQDGFQPTLRFTDLFIPPLPRLRRMFLLLNRTSTFAPMDRIGDVALAPTVHAQRIPDELLVMIESAPHLTAILYNDLVRPNISGEVEIRSYTSDKGETFCHVRVFSPQFCGPRPGFWSLYRDVSGVEGVWQDWTSYRGRLIEAPTLAWVYADGQGMPRPGRRLKLPDETWAVLDAAVEQDQ